MFNIVEYSKNGEMAMFAFAGEILPFYAEIHMIADELWLNWNPKPWSSTFQVWLKDIQDTFSGVT